MRQVVQVDFQRKRAFFISIPFSLNTFPADIESHWSRLVRPSPPNHSIVVSGSGVAAGWCEEPPREDPPPTGPVPLSIGWTEPLSGVPPDGGIDEVVIGGTGASELLAPFAEDAPLSGDALETGGSGAFAVSVGPEKCTGWSPLIMSGVTT